MRHLAYQAVDLSLLDIMRLGEDSLSLAIVRQLAHVNGWRVGLAARPGGGLIASVGLGGGGNPEVAATGNLPQGHLIPAGARHCEAGRRDD